MQTRCKPGSRTDRAILSGVIRVVLVKEEDGSWRALLRTDPAAEVTAKMEAALERWSIERSFHDLKEVERISEVQLRRYDGGWGGQRQPVVSTRLWSCGPGFGRQQPWPIEVTVRGTIRRGGLLTRITASR